MRFRQRLTGWAVTGFLQQTLLIGFGAGAALILMAVTFLLIGSLIIRAALPAVDRRIDAGWAEALGPLSTLPDRYPPIETNDRARLLESTASGLGISLAAEDDSSGNRPTVAHQESFDSIRDLLATMEEDGWSRVAASRAVELWFARNRGSISELVNIINTGETPIWAMSLDHCSGSVHADLQGLVELHRVLAVATYSEIESGDFAAAERILEASWRLNEGLLMSPRLAEHVAAITVTDLQMAALRELEAPGSHWHIRLAALDIERHALEAYRFDAWRLRCQTDSFLADFNPLIGIIAHPFARLLAIPQHQALVWAVEELPGRDPGSFDPDLFVAEHHRQVPRWNPVARAALRRDWNSWPRSIRSALNVELTLRVLELRASVSGSGRFDSRDVQRRQPSQIPGIDWRYQVLEDRIEITLEDQGSVTSPHSPLMASVSLIPSAPTGSQP